MESDGLLDVDSEVDMFSLHFVASDLLQRSVRSFMESRSTNHQTPIELYTRGLAYLREQRSAGLVDEEDCIELIQVVSFVKSFDSRS